MTLITSFEWIDNWLRDNAAQTFACLRPGATDAEIFALADHLGIQLLPEIVQLLRWHNGSDQVMKGWQFWPSFCFLDIENIRHAWTTRNEVKDEAPETDWETSWVPIASNSGGGHLVIDHSTGHLYRKVFYADIEQGAGGLDRDHSWLPTLDQMIERIRASLADDLPLGPYLPYIEGGCLNWALP